MFFKSYMVILFLLILMILFSFNKYFLMFMINMEFLVMSNLFFMSVDQNMFEWLFIYYLILSVCDVVIGLSILVSITKMSKEFNIMKMNLLF